MLMTTGQAVALQILRDATDERFPFSWMPSLFGYERVVHVFNIEVPHRRDFLRTVRHIRRQAEDLAGGPLVFVFHSTAATVRHYPQHA